RRGRVCSPRSLYLILRSEKLVVQFSDGPPPSANTANLTTSTTASQPASSAAASLTARASLLTLYQNGQ
ncbi:unnamed protein product, partial [Arabidopsis halleri]